MIIKRYLNDSDLYWSLTFESYLKQFDCYKSTVDQLNLLLLIMAEQASILSFVKGGKLRLYSSHY